MEEVTFTRGDFVENFLFPVLLSKPYSYHSFQSLFPFFSSISIPFSPTNPFSRPSCKYLSVFLFYHNSHFLPSLKSIFPSFSSIPVPFLLYHLFFPSLFLLLSNPFSRPSLLFLFRSFFSIPFCSSVQSLFPSFSPSAFPSSPQFHSPLLLNPLSLPSLYSTVDMFSHIFP